MTTQVELPREQSWREIRQAVNPRTMTKEGRKRFGWNLFRATCSLLTVGALGALGVYLWLGFESPSETLAPVVKAEPLREVVLITDGVLDKSWVLDRLALPDGIALMAIDLDLAKLHLEREGQVRDAVITRDFPGTLVVTLQERVPVVRIMVPVDPGRPEALLVGRDGEIYRGFNYEAAMISSLPWLDGVRLRRRGGGFEPLQGMDAVSDLLLAARTEAPHLAKDWRIVSLERLPQLVIRTPAVREIIFEAGNHRRQLARLDYILDHYKAQGLGSGAIERIDLSIAGQVSVGLAETTTPPTSGTRTVSSQEPGRTFSSFTRNLTKNQSNRGL